MPAYSVSMSVVTYNSEKHIGELLDSIAAHVRGVAYHLYVIDNGSTDRTIEIVKSRDDGHITLMENKENVGFGRGHNLILDRIRSQYHACINPDIFIKDDVIGALSAYLDAHQEIGLVTPKVLYPNGELQILPKRNPKVLYLLSRKCRIGALKKYREAFEMREKDPDTAFDIEFCTGCFLFVRTDLLKKVGGFDERFFLYFEDADLGRKIRRYARTQYNPAFVVYHYWQRASDKKIRFFLIQLSSMRKYFRKWKNQAP